MRALSMIVVVATVACGGSSTAGSGGSGGSTDAGGGDTVPLEIPECAADEAARFDGGCAPVGARDCADGFESDEVGGCLPILPEDDCPLGQMKILGETTCVEIAPCRGKWGAAPVDAQTIYVDASYAGGASDGSEASPYTVLQDALFAAPAGATVAIAAGDYDWVQVVTTVDLWGACPADVRIHGGFTTADAVALFVAAPGVTVHDLTITDSTFGVVAVAPELVLENVLVHDLASYGLWIDGDYAPGASATVRHSAFVRTSANGVAAFDAPVTVEDLYVSDTQTNANGESGRGLATRPGTSHASVTIDGLVIDKSRIAGMFLRGTVGSIARAYVADTLGRDDGSLGRGVVVDDYLDGAMGVFPSDLTLSDVVVERSRAAGLVVEDSAVVATNLTVRDVVRDETETITNGQGIIVLGAVDAAELSLSGALVERAVASGVFVGSGGTAFGGQGVAMAEVTGLLVRNIAPRQDGLYGFGIYAQGSQDLLTQTELTVRDSLVEDTFTAGILTLETNPQILDSHVRSIAGAAEEGEYIGEFGDGVVVTRYFVGAQPVEAVVDGLVVEQVARAGVANFGSAVALSHLLSSCNPIHLNGETNVEGIDYGYDVSGTSLCGCEVVEDCKVLSSGLTPPPLFD